MSGGKSYCVFNSLGMLLLHFTVILNRCVSLLPVALVLDNYRNDSKFSDREVWPKNKNKRLDSDQTAPQFAILYASFGCISIIV